MNAKNRSKKSFYTINDLSNDEIEQIIKDIAIKAGRDKYGEGLSAYLLTDFADKAFLNTAQKPLLNISKEKLIEEIWYNSCNKIESYCKIYKKREAEANREKVRIKKRQAELRAAGHQEMPDEIPDTMPSPSVVTVEKLKAMPKYLTFHRLDKERVLELSNAVSITIKTEAGRKVRIKSKRLPQKVKSLGQIINEEIIKPNKLSIKEVAEAAGMTRKNLSEIINGKYGLNRKKAKLLGKVLEKYGERYNANNIIKLQDEWVDAGDDIEQSEESTDLGKTARNNLQNPQQGYTYGENTQYPK